MRVLLLNVPGATSFRYLKSFEGRAYDTYAEVCKARNLIEDDRQWTDTMREASLTDMPYQLRLLFASLLQFCNVHNPFVLWESFKPFLIEDFLHRSADVEESTQRALIHINQLLPKPLSDYNLPELNADFNAENHLDIHIQDAHNSSD